jgi:hypothetical protein
MGTIVKSPADAALRPRTPAAMTANASRNHPILAVKEAASAPAARSAVPVDVRPRKPNAVLEVATVTPEMIAVKTPVRRRVVSAVRAAVIARLVSTAFSSTASEAAVRPWTVAN